MIASLFNDGEADAAIRFYGRWKRLGMPYANWADCPAILVEVVETLEPIDRFYHPQRSLL